MADELGFRLREHVIGNDALEVAGTSEKGLEGLHHVAFWYGFLLNDLSEVLAENGIQIETGHYSMGVSNYVCTRVWSKQGSTFWRLRLSDFRSRPETDNLERRRN